MQSSPGKDQSVSNTTDLHNNKMSIFKSFGSNSENKLKTDDVVFVIDEGDEDLEDVPGDFFDDFLKEDFMAGLDIVDDDEWEENKGKVDSSMKNENEDVKKDSVPKAGEIDLRNKIRKKREKREEEKLISQNKGKSRNRINADEFDIRRDPKKTKRDIEQDKAKRDKDKEKKMISEKLKLVETGLVPPGMEMETDLDELKKTEGKLGSTSRNSKVESKTSPSSKVKRKSPLKSSDNSSLSRRLSPSRNRISPYRNRTSPLTIRSRKSPLKRSPRRSPKRSPRRSPKRSPRRSPKRSPRRSPRRRSPRRSPLQRLNDRTPRLRSRDRSLERSIEKTLSRLRRSRSPDIYSSRRSKYSPDYFRHKRSRSRSRDRQREEKKSFLQEIAEKLREAGPSNPIPQHHPYMAPNPVPLSIIPTQGPIPIPAPAPVPPPMAPVFPITQPIPQNQYDPFDQSFFIGTNPHPNGNQPFVGSTMQLSPLPQPTPMLPSPAGGPILMATPTSKYPPIVDTKEDISKLFYDKKITLSKFLAITAKPEVFSTSPAHLKEKIQVISRCQDAIRFLEDGDKKFTGRLVVHQSAPKKDSTVKFVSPLMKMSSLKIPFTEVPKKIQPKNSFSNFMNNLLNSVGLLDETVVDLDANDESSVVVSNVIKSTSPPPPPLISHKHHEIPYESVPKKPIAIFSKWTQTEVFKCFECESRKKILYKSVGTCCGSDNMSFSVGTQVNEDDFNNVKIPKNQSLASLTPAQLLAGARRYPEDESYTPKSLSLSNTLTQMSSIRSGFSRISEFIPPPTQSRFLPPDREREEPPYSGPSQYSGVMRGRGSQIDEPRFGNFY